MYSKGIYLLDLPLDEMKLESELIDSDIYDVLAPEAAVRRRHSLGELALTKSKFKLKKLKLV